MQMARPQESGSPGVQEWPKGLGQKGLDLVKWTRSVRGSEFKRLQRGQCKAIRIDDAHEK